MKYGVQMSWLNTRISTLKYKDNLTDAEKLDLEALQAIRRDIKMLWMTLLLSLGLDLLI